MIGRQPVTNYKSQLTSHIPPQITRAGAGSGSGSGILRDIHNIHTHIPIPRRVRKRDRPPPPPRRLLCGSLASCLPACLPAGSEKARIPSLDVLPVRRRPPMYIPACARVGSSQSLGAAVAHVCTEQKGVQDGEDRRYSGCTGRTTTGGPSRAHWAGTNKPQMRMEPILAYVWVFECILCIYLPLYLACICALGAL